jgi:hypothetical protein
MPALVAGIHVFLPFGRDVDGLDKPGHDEEGASATTHAGSSISSASPTSSTFFALARSRSFSQAATTTVATQLPVEVADRARDTDEPVDRQHQHEADRRDRRHRGQRRGQDDDGRAGHATGARIGNVSNAPRIPALKYHLRSTSAHALPTLQAVPSVGRKLISISLIVGARMTLLQPVLFAALNATDPPTASHQEESPQHRIRLIPQ